MKNKKELFLFPKLRKVIAWILISFEKQGTVPLSPLLGLVDALERLYQTRGLDFTIKYCKASRGNLMNYLSGSSERFPLSKTTKDGLPVILGELIPIVRNGSYLAIAMIFTILFSTRSLKTGKEPDLSTITQPTRSGDVTDFSRFMISFWKDLGYRPTSVMPKYMSAKTEMYRSKAGPNGHALVSSYIDAQALTEQQKSDLITLGGEGFRNFLFISCHKRMWNYLLINFAPLASIISKLKRPVVTRRLSYFADKEDKVRVVGILDWFSQVALRPLHNFLMNVLKRIPQDCTNDQAKFLSIIKDKEIYYSIDLTAATDRFPIDVIYNLLCSRFPESFVAAWKRIMVGTPFDVKLKDGIHKVHYSVGNPMGAYSSFVSFALAHHYIIYFICREQRKNWKKLPYALLGDDIVICDAQVAERYIQLIQFLGMDYSVAKTHKSKDFYEFAKRIFYKGQEVSPFPFSALRECSKSNDLLTTLVWSLERKGSWIPKRDVLSTVSEYFRLVETWRRKYIKKNVLTKSWLLLGILNIVHGVTKADDFLNEIIRVRGYRLPTLSEEVCKNIIMNCVVSAFADSNIAKSLDFNVKDVPLWKTSMALNKGFMEYQSDLADSDPDFDDIFIVYINSPLPLAQKAVLNEYNELLDKIKELDKTGVDWSYKLKTFALPKSDKSLLDKGDYVLSKAATSFGNLVDEQLMILQEYPQLLSF